MAESLREAEVLADNDALTLHRLLGYDRTNSQRFVHGRGNPLPHDVVVVDNWHTFVNFSFITSP